MKHKLLFSFLLIFAFCFSLYAQQADVATQQSTLTQQEKVILDNSTPPTNFKGIPKYSPKGIVQWSQGFEGTFPPAGWAVYQLDGGANTWLQYNSTPIFGTYSAAVRWESTTLINDDWLVTHQFLVHQGDVFRFWAVGSTSYFDSVQIYVSTTGGTPPTGYNYLTTVRPMAVAMYEVPLNAYNGQNVYMAFRYYALDMLRLYVDSVYVETPVANDVGMNALNIPGEVPVGAFTPTAQVKNFGSSPQTFNVTLTINPGGYTNTQAVTTLAPGATADITFTNWNAVLGSFQASCYTQLAGDANPANDTLKKNIVVASVIYNNGPFVNAPGGGPGGADGSVLAADMNTLGSNHSSTAGYRVADDFVIPVDHSWTIDAVTFYAYQTGSTTTSTFTAYNYKIWNGEPGNPASTVVFGDGTTNRMISTAWSNAYRYSTTTVGTTRPIMASTCSAGVTLGPGTYWIDWQATGSLSSGPWAIPITITGQHVTGNAIQWQLTTWAPVNDSLTATTVYQQGLPYVFKGIDAAVPVELTSFTASVDKDAVSIKWITATEKNNKGFDIERKSTEGSFEKIGYVEGFGTTSNTQQYSYTDRGLQSGKYFYRLKQVDFDGTFEYSSAIEVGVDNPTNYTLEQNYPNPFNPSTSISFALKADSKVIVKVFNTLGEEVSVVVNSELKAGSYKVDFNAANLTSGVYYYRIDASGIDGSTFSSVKKMMLMK